MKTLQDGIISKKVHGADYSNIDINQLLKENQKIVAFMGASKSGTSFIINNVQHFISSKGVNVAILDTTQSRSSYYLYTKNEENLRKIAAESIGKLVEGVAEGISVNENLTVYTAMPKDNKDLEFVEPILETLIKKHSLVLIDCDFNTPANYFKYANEIYLLQTMDILTIQPLTEILLELTNKGILDSLKLRIIINKYIKTQSVAEKEIIGAMSYYNDPTMSYMKELFNKNLVKYVTIPYDRAIYEKYIEVVVNCDINLSGYPNNFMHALEQLSNEINPIKDTY